MSRGKTSRADRPPQPAHRYPLNVPLQVIRQSEHVQRFKSSGSLPPLAASFSIICL
jgi:hypothetical protein